MDEWINQALVLLGVIIGALIGPIANEFYTHKKTKREQKGKLIKAVSRLYTTRMAVVAIVNGKELSARGIAILMEVDAESDTMNDRINLFHEIYQENLRNTQVYIQQHLEARMEIVDTLAGIETYHGKRLHKEIDAIMESVIDEFDRETLIMDYSKLTAEEVDKLSKNVMALTSKQQHNLSLESKGTIKKIRSLF
jgi:hypothetical protein